MSYTLGQRMKEIRTQKDVSQESVAAVLGISRQRLARIENGYSEISYEMIKKVANYFAIPISDITSANEEVDLKLFFREVENADEVEDSVDKIVEIIKTFHAHEKLYYRMKVDSDEI